ncbi:hypothetical protein ACTFIZ_007031 [Dictyostelium cf. discoideum]
MNNKILIILLIVLICFINFNYSQSSSTFYVESSMEPPTEGINMEFYLYNINIDNQDKTPTITFTSSKLKTYGSRKNITTFNFQIPRGCGNDNDIVVEIGTNSYQMKLSYQAPIITSCSIVQGNNNLVMCIGDNFGSDVANLDGSKTIIKYSDQVIPIKTFNDSSITFEIQDYYFSDYINIDVCNVSIATNYLINIDPIFKSYSLPIPLHKSNEIVDIIGIHFSPTLSNSSLNCNISSNSNSNSGSDDDNDNNNNNNTNLTPIICKFENSLKFSCNLSIVNSKIKACSILVNNIIQDTFNIIYSEPIIERVTSIYSYENGNITIYGTDFYEPIQFVKIGNLDCLNPNLTNNYHHYNDHEEHNDNDNNSKSYITCQLLALPDDYNINFNVYINVTVKSDGLIGIYQSFRYLDKISQGSDNHDQDDKLKWMIPVIIIPIFFGMLTIFIPFILCKNKSTMTAFNNCCMKRYKDPTKSKRNSNGMVSSKIPNNNTTKSISDVNIHGNFANYDD